MHTRCSFREGAAGPKPMARPELEASAAKHGVTVAPAMSDRAIAEAIAERLMPGAYKFAGRDTDTYALCACELALAAADKAAAAADKVAADADMAAAAPSVAVQAAPARMINGTGAIISAADERAAMIRLSQQ